MLCINSNGDFHNMKNKYMTPKEVATELEVSSATVVRWVRDGTISAKRFGSRIIKIPRIEVERLVNQDQAVIIK
jgi:excisionase family DNA binding protein